jgi:hypothetical protein
MTRPTNYMRSRAATLRLAAVMLFPVLLLIGLSAAASVTP